MSTEKNQKERKNSRAVKIIKEFSERIMGDHVGAYAAQSAFFILLSFIPFMIAASEYHSVYTADRGGCQQRGDVHHSRRFSRSSENHYYGDIPQIFGNPAGVCHYRPLVRGKGHYLSYLRAEHGVPCKRNQKLFCEPSPLHAVYAFFSSERFW